MVRTGLIGDRPGDLTLTWREVSSFLDEQEWIWAKTYAEKAPHWYVTREKCRQRELFFGVVAFIRAHGQEEKFWRQTYTYLYYGDFKYWAMGLKGESSVEQAIVINRARVNFDDF